MLCSCKTVWRSIIEFLYRKHFSQVWVLQGGLQLGVTMVQVLQGAAVQNRKICRRKSNTASAFPAFLAFLCSRYLSQVSQRSWVSKHLQIFISMERFIGLPCNSCCICSFLTSGAGMLYSVQSSWFTSYQRIMYVLYSYSVVAKVTYLLRADQNVMLLSGLWIHLPLVEKFSRKPLFLSMYSE